MEGLGNMFTYSFQLRGKLGFLSLSKGDTSEGKYFGIPTYFNEMLILMIKKKFYWRIVALQCRVSFCYTAK